MRPLFLACIPHLPLFFSLEYISPFVEGYFWFLKSPSRGRIQGRTESALILSISVASTVLSTVLAQSSCLINSCDVTFHPDLPTLNCSTSSGVLICSAQPLPHSFRPGLAPCFPNFCPFPFQGHSALCPLIFSHLSPACLLSPGPCGHHPSYYLLAAPMSSSPGLPG